ncbi:bifunctional diaminohydroxyphosphoribosylaminopyrimidine deaminase/5-amino-6-(5-phosphoribosylamino)uracil reductase RibD [Phaeacidiphilus oryzae]|uniref:bifunctional diaminohydroxyphosphoribosylaminopyrimidine deaminase/5-amino-6-(5-phosphoribosylamino)uracil reductase RibD n=1 Tax=Phaeacidiphilus oryzae TaxID=348818 RepID=UPI000A05C089|nr:bifunctional diaminohydroxyphosphoribosylaminopyrimidine deaminase/5-amino-6-(5-phosphoribosylamino)uracil reductase RibD [Phaeacidiphilus oryzae]
MRRAIELAARGLGRTSPNPIVGSVILDADDNPVGEGWHQRAGGPHAEINALAEAGEKARGGTAVVTLEPCNHTGRTGPCAQALIEAGVARVVYAVGDPNQAAAGGAATLRAAGVEVHAGLLAAEAAEANEAWLTAVRTERPFVIWKYAATLDGRSAAADGTSRWITSPESRADVHRLRDQVDAVLVGSGTVLADDPQLTVRQVPGGAGEMDRQPVRVAVDTHAVTPPAARLLDGAATTLILTAEDADASALAPAVQAGRAEIVAVPRSAEGRPGLELTAVLDELYRRGVRSVLLEGGPGLAGAFLERHLVDKIVGYLAPVLLGAGPAALGTAGISTIADALRLDIRDVERFGPDLRITAYPPKPRPKPKPRRRPEPGAGVRTGSTVSTVFLPEES